MKQEIKQWILEHLHSSAITFLTVFLPFFALGIKDLSFEDLSKGGFLGAVSIIGRLIVKVSYDAIRASLVKRYSK